MGVALMKSLSRISTLMLMMTVCTIGVGVPSALRAQDAYFELPEEAEAERPPPQREEERPERLEETGQDQPTGWEAQDTGEKARTVAPSDSKNSDSTLRKNFWRRLSD